jgi:ParB-like nuclease domain
MAKKVKNGHVRPEEWPASSVEIRPLASIIPYDKNPRSHPPEQIDLIAESMRTDGVIAPILVDEKSVIIYGHGRRLAAQKNGFKNYPIIVAKGWSEKQKQAVRIKDNSYAALSGWDHTLLRGEAIGLKAAGYDMPLLGFSEAMTGWLTTGNIIDDPTSQWTGMPQFIQEDKRAFKTIAVHFKDQAAVDAFAKLIKREIGEKTRYLWFPEIEIEPIKRVVTK